MWGGRGQQQVAHLLLARQPARLPVPARLLIDLPTSSLHACMPACLPNPGHAGATPGSTALPDPIPTCPWISTDAAQLLQLERGDPAVAHLAAQLHPRQSAESLCGNAAGNPVVLAAGLRRRVLLESRRNDEGVDRFPEPDSTIHLPLVVTTQSLAGA